MLRREEQGSLWDATPQKRPEVQAVHKAALELANQTRRIGHGLGTRSVTGWSDTYAAFVFVVLNPRRRFDGAAFRTASPL